MKESFKIERKKGTLTLVTISGTSILTGKPELVVTKFGNYLKFPSAVNGGANLVRVNARHRVYDEFTVADKSKATVYRQIKSLPGKELKKGDWHVLATAVSL